MNTLLIAEHNNETLADATVKSATAAAQMGGELHVLVAGANCGAVGEAAAKLDGVAKVLVADDALYEKQLAEPMAALVTSMADGYATIASPASTNGKNFMPRIAALLDCSQISDITAVVDGQTFERPIYAGNAIQTVRTSEPRKAITIRSTAFAAAGDGGRAVAACNRATISPYWKKSPTSWAPRLAPHAPLLTPDLYPMIIRSGRRAKLLHPNFTLLSAFPVPFSIWPA